MFNNICDKTIYVWCRDGSVQKIYKYGKKMQRDTGMAVPKTTAIRCRNGSMQARHVIHRLHK